MVRTLFDLLGGDQAQKIMASSESHSIPGASSPAANVFGAFGAVLGYIGAEAATLDTFEHLLWPQRSYSNFKWHSIPGLALFTAMSGPRHKSALAALDVIFRHGLFKGCNQGHMLGTSFFPQLDWTYTMHGDCKDQKAHTEPLRNCIWARALTYLPMLPTQASHTARSADEAEKGNVKEEKVLRARVAVSHLTISRATPAEKQSSLPFVSEDANTPGGRVFLAILTSELAGILFALCVCAAFHSAWGALWLAPLLVKLFSAFFALRREQLVSTISSAASDGPVHDFEVHCPQSEGNFMLLSGPPTLVLQFFRHYGHPKRHRVREVVQLFCIVLFICLFPLELLCSMIWMPIGIQYVWLSYQLYVVLAMYMARYSHIDKTTTTEFKIAEAIRDNLDSTCQTAGSGSRTTILFGHHREGPNTLKIDVSVTHHTRYKEGKEKLEELLQRVPCIDVKPQ